MKKTLFIIATLSMFFTLSACKGRHRASNLKADTIAMAACPSFNEQNAFNDIQTQCDFGPRVPGTQAWKDCSAWIEEEFKKTGCEVSIQETTVKVWDGSTVPCRNIIARMNPENTDRLLLCAHWDTRPWADNDENEQKHKEPILGANDGASGVAVILEIARQLKAQPITTGVDFICFDVEDMGTPQWVNTNEDTNNTWCLGSTYWAQQAAKDNYHARFGILFDMVGGRGAQFAMEGISRHYAEPVVQLLWHTAHQLGYGHYFPLKDGGYVTDDHLPINQIVGVPTLDIVPHHEDGPSSFGPTWHTAKDTPENIDSNTLKAVGQSVLQLIYNDAAE